MSHKIIYLLAKEKLAIVRYISAIPLLFDGIIVAKTERNKAGVFMCT